MICLAVSRVSLFEAEDDTDDLVGAGREETHDCMLRCATGIQLDQE